MNRRPFFAGLVMAIMVVAGQSSLVVDIPHLVNPVTRTAAGTYEFAAANVDTVMAEFTGQSMPIEGTTFLYIDKTATITGGIGRFAHATGEFDDVRLFDTSNGTTCG